MIAICAAYAGLSLASTGGALILATRATSGGYSKDEESKDFIKLFAVSAVSLLVIITLALIGIYSIF